MKGLRKLMGKVEDAMAASAFAEAGEFETAREILRESQKERVEKRVDRTYTRPTVQNARSK